MKSSEKGRQADWPPPENLIPLNTAAKLSGLSTSHLRVLVRQNDIWGRKIGRDYAPIRRPDTNRSSSISLPTNLKVEDLLPDLTKAITTFEIGEKCKSETVGPDEVAGTSN